MHTRCTLGISRNDVLNTVPYNLGHSSVHISVLVQFTALSDLGMRRFEKRPSGGGDTESVSRLDRPGEIWGQTRQVSNRCQKVITPRHTALPLTLASLHVLDDLPLFLEKCYLLLTFPPFWYWFSIKWQHNYVLLLESVCCWFIGDGYLAMEILVEIWLFCCFVVLAAHVFLPQWIADVLCKPRTETCWWMSIDCLSCSQVLFDKIMIFHVVVCTNNRLFWILW